MPLEILPAFKAVNAEPSPVKLPTKESAELLKVTLLEYVPANCPLGKLPVSVAAFTLLNPVKLPAKLLAGLLSTLTPLKVLAAVSEAPPRFDKALDGVPDPVPPWTSGTKPLEMLVAFNPVNPKPSPLNVPMKVLAALLNAT